MPCERFRNALTDAATGEPVALALAAHLEGCVACRSELAELRRLMAAADDELSALTTAEPSPALRARIREEVAESGPAPAVRWGFAWTATAAAVLALAAFGVWRASVAHAPSSPAVTANGTPRPPAVSPASVAARPPQPPAAVASATVGTASDGLPSQSTHEAESVRPAVMARRPASAEPEVLVPAGQREALLQLVALVHRERLDVPTLATAGRPLADLAGPAAIDIRPLEIVPLDPAESPGTD